MTASERAKPDQILGDYRLLGFLGEGAAGEVHLAVPLKPKPFAKTDQLVAIKIYKPEILARHAQIQSFHYDSRTVAHSVGTVLDSLLHGDAVFASESHLVRLSKLVTESHPPFDSTISSRDDTSAMLLRLTKNLLTKDPKNRPSIDEV